MKKSIVQWCKEQVEAGNELSIAWEGGGDSGWAYFNINGQQIENEYTEALITYMYDILDYGSWAGEFNASGEAYYNPKNMSFEGVDNYSEDGHDVVDSDFTITIPKKYWFDSLSISVDSSYDETPNIDVSFNLKNGFLTKEHMDFCSNLEDALQKEFDEFLTKCSLSDDVELRGCTDSWLLERNNAIEGIEHLIFKIDRVEIQTSTTEEKEIMLELDENIVTIIDNMINNQSNAKENAN